MGVIVIIFVVPVFLVTLAVCHMLRPLSLPDMTVILAAVAVLNAALGMGFLLAIGAAAGIRKGVRWALGRTGKA